MFKKSKKDELVELVQEVINSTPLECRDAGFVVGDAYRAGWMANFAGLTRSDRVYVKVDRIGGMTGSFNFDESAKVIAEWSEKVADRVSEKGVRYFFDWGVDVSFRVQTDSGNNRLLVTDEKYLVEFDAVG